MNAPPNDEPRQRKTSPTLWLLGLLLLLIVTLVGFSLFGPNPPIEIGIATTRITTPLDANGLPDYAAVLLAESRKGVTPENNGAVLFLMSMWPNEASFQAYSAEDAKLLCAELGLPGVPPIEGRVRPLDTERTRLAIVRLLRERFTPADRAEGSKSVSLPYSTSGLRLYMTHLSGEEFFTCLEADAAKDIRVYEVLDRCKPTKRSWTREELPFLTEWLEENNAAVDRLVEAAERPKWYFPEPAMLRGKTGTVMYNYHNVMMPQDAAHLLLTRSHFFQGEKKYDEALRDATAILRLAHFTSKQPLVLDQMVACVIGKVGCRTIDRMVIEEVFSTVALRQLLKEFDQIGPFSRMDYVLDHGDRFLEISSVFDQFTDRRNRYGAGIPYAFFHVACDWNHVLRDINRHFDALVAATKLPTWSQRQAAYSQLSATIDGKLSRSNFSSPTAQESLRLLTPSGRGQALADRWLGVSIGHFGDRFIEEDRVTTTRQLTRLGIALAIFRSEQGDYPESLEELIPGILPTLPMDLFHNQPLAYRKTNDGYLLYSLGPNGNDDEGSNRNRMWGPWKLEGVNVEPRDDSQEETSDWDEDGEYVGGSLIETKEEADSPHAKIPAGADDLSLRVPLPEPEPWPWERNN